jgi:glycine cleavage system H protein
MTTRYTEDHEYVQVEDDLGTVGITDYAQQQLGDIVFVELPSTGTKVRKGDEVAVVESVKAASEIYAPVSGTVVEVNEAVNAEPGLVNTDPAGGGWLFKLQLDDAGELEGLMDDQAYASHTA